MIASQAIVGNKENRPQERHTLSDSGQINKTVIYPHSPEGNQVDIAPLVQKLYTKTGHIGHPSDMYAQTARKNNRHAKTEDIHK